jgi:4-hydroxybenzoyl-CoA thioesterase
MFMQEIGWPYWRTHEEEGYGLPLVEANFEFERPLHGGDEVTVGLTPDLGNRSVRFTYEARVEGDLSFSAYEQRVCQSTGAEGAMPIPDALREAMEPYAAD